jgi:hypothetical protein
MGNVEKYKIIGEVSIIKKIITLCNNKIVGSNNFSQYNTICREVISVHVTGAKVVRK